MLQVQTCNALAFFTFATMKKAIKFILIGLVVVIVGAVALVLLRPNNTMPSAEVTKKWKDPASTFLTWRGGQVHYTDEGKGQTVLMIHGFGGNYKNFQSLAEIMRDEYRVVRIDLPGFGLSDFPKEGYTDINQTYTDYLQFIADTLHLDSIYVIGNSRGGAITWNMAIQQPELVQKIVLLNSAGYDVAKVAEKLAIFKFKSFGKVFEKGMPAFMSNSGLKKCYADLSKFDPSVAAMNNEITNREGNVMHMLGMASHVKFPDTALIQQVACPTLIIWGEQDQIVPREHADRFKRDIKGSELVVFDPCGHVPMMERPEDTKREVVRFFKQ